MDNQTIHDWFNCPYCGCPDEVKFFLVGNTTVSVDFECQSRDHQFSRSNFSRFAIEDKRWFGRYANEKATLRSILFKPTDRMHPKLSACLSCINCASSNTDGAIEAITAPQAGTYGKSRCLYVTVWCRDCETTDSEIVLHTGNSIDTETVRETSNYPPSYL